MLVALSGQPVFRPVFDALSGIEVYNLNPLEISALQPPDPGELLRRDGSNAASVLQNLDERARARVNDYLSRIVPGVHSAEPKTFGKQETMEFRQVVQGQQHPWNFLAASMSDGTLRALGILLAIHQRHATPDGLRPPSLIGLEEPETALHPAAARHRRRRRRGQLRSPPAHPPPAAGWRGRPLSRVSTADAGTRGNTSWTPPPRTLSLSTPSPG